MRTQNKTLLVILVGLPVILMAAVAFVGAKFYQPGTIAIQVVEKGAGGTSIGFRMPAMVLPVAAHCLPREVRNEIHCEMSGDVLDHFELVRTVLDELSGCPDGVFVEVRSATEMVVIEKRGGQLVVEVDTPTEAVHCSVPLRSVSTFLDAI
jgi:hypothetical protein